LRALITGASSGIGEACGHRFAREGGRVALLARRLERLEKVAARARELGGETLVLVADVAHREAVRAAVQKAEQAFGGLDVLVANAGFGVYNHHTARGGCTMNRRELLLSLSAVGAGAVGPAAYAFEQATEWHRRRPALG